MRSSVYEYVGWAANGVGRTRPRAAENYQRLLPPEQPAHNSSRSAVHVIPELEHPNLAKRAYILRAGNYTVSGAHYWDLLAGGLG